MNAGDSLVDSITFALPTGENISVDLRPNKVLSTKLAKSYKGLESFDIYKINKQEKIGHLTITNDYAVGQIVVSNQLYKVHKTLKGGNSYSVSTIVNQSPITANHGCGIEIKQDPNQIKKENSKIERIETSGDINTFRLAVVATGGYYVDNGANDELVLLSIVDAINRLNDIYIKELGVVFELLPPYIQNLTPETDEFTTSIDDPNADPGSKNEQAANAVARHFDASDYDIGHVFSSLSDGVGFDLVGLANIGAVCRDFIISNEGNGLVKAGGWSGVTSDFIQTLAHEVGHMFGANHTFNGSGRFCDNAISDGNAFEIGSGSTIMSYFSLCSQEQNVFGRLGLYFHAHSIIQMLDYMNQFACGIAESSTNSPPKFDSEQCVGTSIPINTPFLLNGHAYDDEGDQIVSNWEQYDEDGPGIPTQGFIGNSASNSPIAPLFTSELPNTKPNRLFPSIQILLDSTNSDFEALPAVAREMNFRYTMRDNIGGTASDQIKVDVAPSGPMMVTAPTANSTFDAGQEFTIEWNPNGSQSICSSVDIELSLDGGFTFGLALATDIDYADLSHQVILPNNISNTNLAKIRVICSDNDCVQFFNLSEGTFNINSACSAANTWFFPDEPVNILSSETDLLNFDFTVFQILEEDISISFAGTEPTAPPFGRESDDCQQANFEDNYSIIRFTVTNSGDYSFWLDDFITVAVFNGEAPDLNNPCTSVIAVNRTFANIFNVTRAFLEAGQVYSIVIYGQQGDAVAISPTGPGQLLTSDLSFSDYTYLAVNESGDLVAVSSSADFTNLVSGNYLVYGINTNESVIIENYINQPINDLLFDECLRFSSNAKDIRIRQSCSVSETISSTICSFQSIAGYNQSGRHVDVFPMGEGCDSTRTIDLTVLPTQLITLDTAVCGNVSLFGRSESGSFLDTLIQDNQCFIVDLTLTVLAAPEIEVFANLENSDVCDGGPLLIQTSTVDQSLSYEWSNNSTGSSIEVTTSGLYSVTAINTSNCTVVDSIFVDLERNVVTSSHMTICEGETISGYNSSGTYEDRFTRANQCDSIHILELEVIPAVRATIEQTICSGDQFLGYDSAGTYEEIFVSVAGCDSIRTLVLTIPDEIVGSSVETICSGENFQGRSEAGQYVDIFLAAEGCDSTHELTLVIIPADTTMIEVDICVGQEFLGRNSSGVFEETYSNSRGCDSILIVDLSVLSTVTQSVFEQICEGETFEGYSATGMYEDLFTGSSGCDSIRRLNLVVIENQTTTVNETICNGESYEGYTESATYVDILTSSLGCDSTRILNLTVLMPVASAENQFICPGENFNGLTVSGLYVDTFTTAFGCDSIHTLELQILTSTESIINATICMGEELFGFDETGIYTDVYDGKNGCDSTRIIDLIVIDEIASTTTMTLCEGEFIDGYGVTGEYIDVLQSVGGCDSVRTLLLTVNPAVSAIIESSICAGESLAGYSEAGMFIDVFTSSTGCDSTRTLLLDVNESDRVEFSQSICAGATVAGYSISGIYQDSLLNINGCDSIRTLNLTVLEVSESQISAAICNGEKYESYDVSGTYMDLFVAANGCDSLRTLDLTVLPSDDAECRTIDLGNYEDLITIYPNPASTEIRIDMPPRAQLISLNIYDTAGRLVYASAQNTAVGSMLYVENLSSGIYILEGLVTDNGTNIYFYKKFFKG